MNKSNLENFHPKYFVLDVDGVLTDGTYQYTVDGKVAKFFGPDDNDALCLLKKYLEIYFISGDKRGFPITKKRVLDDMKFPLELVSTFERVHWIENKFGLQNVIFMGDGIFDAMVFDKVPYGIAPANAFATTKELANFVTKNSGGHGAVAEACLHIMEKFFKPFDPLNPEIIESGLWKKAK